MNLLGYSGPRCQEALDPKEINIKGDDLHVKWSFYRVETNRAVLTTSTWNPAQ